MPVRKQGQTLSRVMGRGRKEPNNPRVSSDDLESAILVSLQDFGLDLSSFGKFDLYKTLLRVAPALVISIGKPLSIYGFGSFRLVRTKMGKARLKFTASKVLNKYLDSFLCGLSFEKTLEDLLRIGKSKDTSVEEARHEY